MSTKKKNVFLSLKIFKKLPEMAKKNQDTDVVSEQIVEQFSRTEKFVNENKSMVSIIAGAIVVLVAGYFVYTNFIVAPREKEATSQMFQAVSYFEAQQFDVAINGDGTYPGFLEITQEYGGTKSANLAHYYMGMSFLNTGQYEAAIEELESFSTDDPILGSMKLGGVADAHAQLGNMEKAASNYAKAASFSKDKFTAPMYLMRSGLAYEQVGNGSKAVEAYTRIQKDYADAQEARDIEKFIARAGGAIN
ncbi:MAG: tetratricopeptide (TPR) repeat protein [Sphingobacteriales bacterium]